MAALRFAPLFALPVLGGVLLAFVIATFEDDPPEATQATSAPETELPGQQDTAAEPTVEVEQEEPAVIDPSPADVPDPLANLNLDPSFEVDDFSAYWRENLPPALADILENGFPNRDNAP